MTLLRTLYLIDDKSLVRHLSRFKLFTIKNDFIKNCSFTITCMKLKGGGVRWILEVGSKEAVYKKLGFY